MPQTPKKTNIGIPCGADCPLYVGLVSRHEVVCRCFGQETARDIPTIRCSYKEKALKEQTAAA